MNIFARELVIILGDHEKELSNLFGLRNEYFHMLPSKVTRLKRSLSEDITATLSSDELELLQAWVPLDETGQEMRHLRAALVAETVHRLLAGRMDGTNAQHVGELVLALLLATNGDESQQLSETILQNVRGSLAPPSMAHGAVRGVTDGRLLPEDESRDNTTERIQRALDPAAEAYALGTLWLEIARDTEHRSEQLGYLALARTLLDRARTLAQGVPSFAEGPPVDELLAAISVAKNDLDLLR